MALMSERGKNLQQGESFTLYPSTVTTAVVGATGTVIDFEGERLIFSILLNVTAAAAAANDTLDVYVDCLVAGTTWVNAVHFTQVLGNGGLLQRYANLDSINADMADILVSTDAASGVIRPGVHGSQMRSRWTVVNGTAATFTFAVTGYAL